MNMKKNTKIISILISIILLLSLSISIGCKEKNSDEIPESQYIDNIVGLKVGILYGYYGNDKQGNNFYAEKGIQKAKEKFRIEPVEEYLTTNSDKEIIEKLELLILKSDIIIGVGFDVIREIYSNIGEKYPDITFITIGRKSKFYNGKNVIPVTFRVHEPAYIAGMIASHNSKTNKIGFFSRYRSLREEDFLYGYKRGARFIQPKTDIIGHFGSPNDTEDIVKEKLKKMFYDDVDVIFITANHWRKTAIEMAKKYKAKLITAYGNFFEEAPENIIASVSIGFDQAIYEVLKFKAQGKLETMKEVSIGIEQNIEPIITNEQSSENYVPKKLQKQIKKIKKEIPKGKIFQDYEKINPIKDMEKQ